MYSACWFRTYSLGTYSLGVSVTFTMPFTFSVAEYADMIYVVGSISFRPDIQRPRQMQNALRDI